MKKKYIINEFYDKIIIIGGPILSLILLLIFNSFDTLNNSDYSYLFYISLTQGHLMVSSLRAFGNKKVRENNNLIKFIIYPILIFILIYMSSDLFILFYIIMIYWDIYHSSLQTFGFAKIYDKIEGQDHNLMKYWDKILSLFLYAFPAIIGSSIYYYLDNFKKISETSFANDVPSIKNFFQFRLNQEVSEYYNVILIVALFTFLIFLLSYVITLQKNKIKYDNKKIFLYLNTGLVCFLAGFILNPAKALFVINVFHALQYFTLIYFSEKNNFKIFKIFSNEQNLILLILTFSGIGYILVNINSFYAECFLVTCALWHFWIDGKIWSISKKQI